MVFQVKTKIFLYISDRRRNHYELIQSTSKLEKNAYFFFLWKNIDDDNFVSFETRWNYSYKEFKIFFFAVKKYNVGGFIMCESFAMVQWHRYKMCWGSRLPITSLVKFITHFFRPSADSKWYGSWDSYEIDICSERLFQQGANCQVKGFQATYKF